MADYNVIYEIGQSIIELLKREITPEPIQNKEAIGLAMPHEPEDYQLTVWTYNIEEINETGLSEGYRKDPNNLNIEVYTPMQIKCHILITAHSKAPIQVRLSDEYRIIGRAVQIIKDHPLIQTNDLVGSLKTDDRPLQLQLQKLSIEEISKIWNNANKPIKPSFGLTVNVSMESKRTRIIGSRVKDAEISVIQK